MSPRGIRNNNPGNIRASGIHWPGEGPPDSDGFCTFAQPEQGIAAIGSNLRAYQNRHGLRTVNGIIRRWSATDQDVYVAAVAKALGVGPDDGINVLNPDTLFKLVVAIIRQENGQQPYTYAVICEGLSIPPSAIVEHVQPAAPIDDSRSIEADAATRAAATVGGADNSNTVTQGGSVPFLPVMLSLLPSVLNLFAPRAQASLQKITAQPPDVVQGFVQSLFDKLGQLTGTTDPIQATAAITKDPAQAKVAALEEHALDYLDKLAPVLEKLAGYDAQAWSAEESSRDQASARAKSDAYDPARLLILGALAGMGWLLVFLCAIATYQTYLNGEPSAMVWAAITGVIGFITGVLTTIFAYRFGSSRGSSAKDVLIGEMARQAKG